MPRVSPPTPETQRSDDGFDPSPAQAEVEEQVTPHSANTQEPEEEITPHSALTQGQDDEETPVPQAASSAIQDVSPHSAHTQGEGDLDNSSLHLEMSISPMTA
eukprot:COSAG06_NODE_24023_length_675_cov_0.692708_1_plen_102_part_10